MGRAPRDPYSDVCMHDGTIVQVRAGRFLVQIGDPCGAEIREAPPSEGPHVRSRPAPVLQRPKSIRGLVDRQLDLAAALSALDAGLPVEMTGEAGIGKTALLRHLAHHLRAASFVDGIVYLSARQQPPADLHQLLFEAFCESDGFHKPTDVEIRQALQARRALILLDDVDVAEEGLDQLVDSAPRAAFVIATRERRLWGDVHSLALKGLPADDAVLLLERELERSLDAAERAGASSFCAALGGHPLRIRQAAAVIREQGLSVDAWAGIVTQGPIAHLMGSIDDKGRRVLLALAALPGSPLQALHVSAIAQATDIEPSLTALVRRGLVVLNRSRYRLADRVTDRLRRTEDLKPWTNRAITYFIGWTERHVRNHDVLRQEFGALLRAQQSAVDARRPGDVLQLGRLIEQPLIMCALW